MVSSNVEGSIYLNVSSIDTNAENLTLEYRDSGSSDPYENIQTVSNPGSGESYSWDLSVPGSGEYELRAITVNSSGGEIDNATVSPITVDNSVSSPASKSPTGPISDDSPTVEMTVYDDLSGIDYSYLNVTGPNGPVNSTVGTSLSLSGLDQGAHTVSYYVKDKAGNEKNSSWTFTVDTNYDGSTNPSFSVDEAEGGVVEFNQDATMSVSGFDADSVSKTTVSCVVAGETVGTKTFDAGSTSNSFTCKIGLDEDAPYYDTSAEISLQMEDQAGNTGSSSTKTVTFDATDPYVSGVENVDNLTTFNSPFEVGFEFGDTATSVEKMEYFFDDVSTSTGDGTEISNFDDGQTEIDPSGIGSGNHTLYLRAQDEAGRWSSPASFDFEYYPNKDPKVSIFGPGRVEVTAGETGSFDLRVENTGSFLIESLNLTLDSEVFTAQETISDFEPGDAINFTFEPSAAEEDIGSYTITASTDSPAEKKKIVYRIKANKKQQQNIQSNLQKQVERLKSLESNITSLQKKVSEKRSQQLSQNLSEFKSSVEEAQQAVEKGNYYAAQQTLQGIETDFQNAKNTYSKVEQEYRSARRFMMVMAVIVVILLAALGGVGYLVYDGRIDPEEVQKAIEEKLEGVDSGDSDGEGLIQKIKNMFDSEPEAEEFEWDGFRDDN